MGQDQVHAMRRQGDEETIELLAQELARERSFTRSVFDAAALGIVTADSDGVVGAANRAARKMFCASNEELCGSGLDSHIDEPGFETLREMVRCQPIVEGVRSIDEDIECMAVRSGAVRFPVDMTISNLCVGGADTYTCIIRDVSRRKEAEEMLDILQEQMLDNSRRSGKAEIASSVLHNIGNVLNSVNVSVTVMLEAMREPTSRGMERALGMLEEQGDGLPEFFRGDPRAPKLLKYLASICERQLAQEGSLKGELDGLTDKINHIKAVISMQQEHAGVSSLTARERMASLVGEAVRVNADLAEGCGVVVRSVLENGPESFVVDRHKALQILVNLVKNAIESAAASGVEEPEVVVCAAQFNDGLLGIEVRDNGLGIDPENVTKIFTHGFTTKKNGHGFGLHSCAVIAGEMGGSVEAQSEGVGLGAAFTLRLPENPSEGL